VAEPEPADITLLLHAAANGQGESAERLLPLVYQQLRAIAQQRMAGERKDHTLQATALVHEAYAKLVGHDAEGGKVPWSGRAAFFKVAAEAMQRILVDHARARLAEKRGGSDRKRLDLAIGDVADLAIDEKKSEEIIALDEAICRLQEQEPRVAEVVRLRFYAGLSVDDTAAALGVSPRTVDLDWSFARAWLFRALNRQQ